MFIVAVTKDGRQVQRPGLDWTVFRHGIWTITVGASSSNIRLVAKGGGFSLVESPLATVTQQPEVPVAVVEFSADRLELRISKPLYSGRPLYFHQNESGEFFCSTHVARLRELGVRLQPDEEALPEYLIYRYRVPPSTLYKSVKQIPLGASLRVGLTPEGCTMGKLEYWSPPEPDPSATSGELAAEMVHRLSARLQKLAPVQSQLAVLLSGGLDSTTLFRTAQELFSVRESYSTGFPFEQDGKNVERHYAETAATALGARHHYYQGTPQDYLQGFLSAIAVAEEPVHHLQSVLLYLLFERGLPADKRVVISGEGADGIFGVELQHRVWRREHKTSLLKLASHFPLANAARWFTSASGRGGGFFEPVLRPMPGNDYENPGHELWSLGSYGNTQWVLDKFGCHKEALFLSRLELVNQIRNHSIYDVVSLLSLMGEGAVTETVWSKIGEACGRFVDYPFLDPELLRFAYRTSWEAKLREPKWLIRGALRRLNVPEFIVRRPKSSFGLNHSGWARKGGIFEPFVALATPVFPEPVLRSLQTNESPDASTFWALLNYALWKRICVDGEPVGLLQEELERQMRDTAPVQGRFPADATNQHGWLPAVRSQAETRR